MRMLLPRRAGHAEVVGRNAEVNLMPNLNNVQRESFDWFLKEGLKDLFAEVSPIQPSPQPRRPE